MGWLAMEHTLAIGAYVLIGFIAGYLCGRRKL